MERKKSQVTALVIFVVKSHINVGVISDISTLRFVVVQWPFKDRPRKGFMFAVVAVIWFVSALVVLPTALYTKVTTQYDPQTSEYVSSCVEHWPYGTVISVRCYFIIVLLIEFILPSIIMVYCYGHVVHKIFTVGMVRDTFTGTYNEQNGMPNGYSGSWLTKKKKWTRRTCILMVSVILFICLWMPYYGYTIYRDFYPLHWKQNSQRINLFYLVETLAMSNNMVNTVVYIVMNRTVKRVLMFCSWNAKGRRGAILLHRQHRCRLEYGRTEDTPKSTPHAARAQANNFQVHNF
ncbi:PREDICTED: prokineticin receptor 1-like [Priapulus caudatus]|uniref:Prokineticin receptor 1-like n=1 Tax=Priapulus caudatus TaxID=37621 RepID=A0ABM1ESE2_PRICU|nr:PREDICTED: prokineticin receptor 1-like [Priapulus caudatus]